MKRVTLIWTAVVAASLLGGTIALVEGQRRAHADKPPNAVATTGDRAPRAAEFREITIPAGTALSLSLDDRVGSAISRVDDRVRAHLTRPVIVDGVTAVPERSELSGAVVEVLRSARVKGRARIAIRFDTLRAANGADTYAIRTPAIIRTTPGTLRKDALKVGIPAAAGAVLGGAFGGRKGALIGTAVGGGAGAGYVMSSRGPEIAINKGALLSVKLLDAVKVRPSARADLTEP